MSHSAWVRFKSVLIPLKVDPISYHCPSDGIFYVETLGLKGFSTWMPSTRDPETACPMLATLLFISTTI